MKRLAVLASLLLAAPALAQTHLVIVSGLGGHPKYAQSFAKLATTLAGAAHQRFGIPDSAILWFAEDSASKDPHFRGVSTKVNVERAMQRIADHAKPGEQFVLVLIGHGSGEGDDSKISIPGPDLSAADFARLLGRFTAQKTAFIDLTSASGDMIPTVAAPNRVVITATKSGFERNESHFGEHFVAALSNDVADTDKDGRVSLLEAFRYAVAETKRSYESDSRLQTEHAQLEDRGEKLGTDTPDGKTGEGVFARRFFLDAGNIASLAGSNDPRLGTLYTERFAIEEQIETLKQKKSAMTPDAYDNALEQLLVDLARKARTIREIEGRKS